MLLISQGKKKSDQREVAGHMLLLVSWHRWVMAASVRLSWESRCVGLICMADRWSRPPLAARVTPGTNCSRTSMTLGMLHTILGMAHERPSPHTLGSISSEVLGTRSFTWPSYSLSHAEARAPFLAFAL
jgi:hypothetical protein